MFRVNAPKPVIRIFGTNATNPAGEQTTTFQKRILDQNRFSASKKINNF